MSADREPRSTLNWPQLANSRRIDLAAGVVPARPRGGFRLSLRDVEQRPRVLGDNEYQPRASLATERRLHLGVGPQGRIATLDNAFDGREMFTLSAEAAGESIARIWRFLREWKLYF